ncbi:hypothetical protein DACRYDRAFT_100219 [Dacryopinax primogenitus]|uniref:Uncharacterized protein n=1 Tax=Dacryopinax primogenitus (strain DJM 731) TaxID=1858805 RepID=M5FVX0_DACPD|nr:uncharacterized protein DACRYDRAFT_100219 [Dacryopinax primogenitus]EJU01996.1 hypothetical protein DACRYDRAFT_100219 [Dacryopinax primogenitus]
MYLDSHHIRRPMTTSPPAYTSSSPSISASHRPSLSLHDIPSDTDLPIIDGYTPAPSEPLPRYPRAAQYVFLSLDVGNSVVVDAHTGQPVMESLTTSEDGESSETQLRALTSNGDLICRVSWPSGRKAKAGPTLDWGSGQGAVGLRKWMARKGDPGALLRVKHRGKKYDVFQAGQALGVRYAQKRGREPMLLGIRDPMKYTELVLSPLVGEERGELLELGCVIVLLLKSKKKLGPDFEGRQLRDTIWSGVEKCFTSTGNAQPGRVLT